MAIPVAERVARYQAWRRREPMARPLVGLLWEADIPGLPEFLDAVGEDQWVNAEQIDPRMFLPYIERWHQRESRWTSDIIQSWAPAFSIPWVEAIAGCRVKSYPGSLWAMPCLDSYDKRAPVQLDADNPWFVKLLEFTRGWLSFRAGDFRWPCRKCAVPSTRFRPARRGTDVPRSAGTAGASKATAGRADCIVDPNCRCVPRIDPALPRWICDACQDVAPERATTPQNDISTLVSAKMYHEFALPGDAQITAHFPAHSFHLHGSAQTPDRQLVVARQTDGYRGSSRTYGGWTFARRHVVRRAADSRSKAPLTGCNGFSHRGSMYSGTARSWVVCDGAGERA